MVSNRTILIGSIALALVVIAVGTGIAVYESGGSSNESVARPRATPTPQRSSAEIAAKNDSAAIPGTYVPDQGRAHSPVPFSLSRTPTPFCAGVPHSQPAAAADITPGGSPPRDCYASNPPSSGKHLNVQRNVDVGGGILINIPPDPDVYPPDVEVPRDAIPHILEHAGVFVGDNCAPGNVACDAVVRQMTDIVNDELDNHGGRVVMAHTTAICRRTRSACRHGRACWTSPTTRLMMPSSATSSKRTRAGWIGKDSVADGRPARRRDRTPSAARGTRREALLPPYDEPRGAMRVPEYARRLAH